MHVEWGETGMRESARLVDTVVVVDVLSFTTTVSVALDRGAVVYPLRAGDEYAPRIASRLGAHLAGPRGSRFSLSPQTASGLEAGSTLVLPSPNGGSLCLAAARRGLTVVAGSLRNAAAVAAFIGRRPGRALLVAAGERWRDGTRRFAAEDLIGAGAILSRLDPAGFTPEAHVAVAAFRAAEDHLADTIRDCTSGQELVTGGYPQDPEWAAALDTSALVPVLGDEGFRVAVDLELRS